MDSNREVSWVPLCHRFELKTDNNPLTYILTSPKLDTTGLHWLTEFSNYDFLNSRRSGHINADTDALWCAPAFMNHEEACKVGHLESDGVNAFSQSQMHQVQFMHSKGLGKADISMASTDIRCETFGTLVDVAPLWAGEQCVTEPWHTLKLQRVHR